MPDHISGLSRRRLLVNGLRLGGLAAIGGPLLAACGSDDGASPSGAASGASLGGLTLRLSWIKNVEFAGSYIADTKGYYKDAGFTSVDLLAGGASATPQETDVVTKKAIVGISSPDITGAAITKGAPLKIIGAQYQKNPFAIMSMTSKAIKTPQDMYGKKIGVQATNESVWNAFVKASGIDASKVTKVPVQFDPLPLTQGTVDGWFSFITNEPNDLRSKNFDVTTFMLADFGYPLVSETYMVRQDTIDTKRAVLKGFLKAEIRGWTDNLKDPSLGAGLAANTYGKGLGLTAAEQTLESATENGLILNQDTKQNGIFTVTDELVEANIKTLTMGGLSLTADKLFDFSILKEVYAESPDLISGLPAPSPSASA